MTARSNMYQRNFGGFILFRNYKRTWSLPKEFERKIMDETSDGSVLHLYGGLSSFGTRLDMDPFTQPHVLGNALYPPFKCKTFDYVVMDPPFVDLRSGVAMNLIVPAACIARKKVFWTHTHWPLRNGLGLRMNRWWLGSPCAMGAPVRLLIEYRVIGHPNSCVGWPRRGRKRMNGMIGKYDWSRIVPKPRIYTQPIWQQKLI